MKKQPGAVIDGIVNGLQGLDAWRKLHCGAPPGECENPVVMIGIAVLPTESVIVGAWCTEHQEEVSRLGKLLEGG